MRRRSGAGCTSSPANAAASATGGWASSFVESFNGRFRDECLNEEVFASLAEARVVIERWRQDYNRVRPHSAHGGRTPEAVRLQAAGDRLRNPDQLGRSPAPSSRRNCYEQPRDSHCQRGTRGHSSLHQVIEETQALARPRDRARLPVLGHMKCDSHLDRNYLKGRHSDHANAILAAVGCIFRLIPKWIRLLLHLIGYFLIVLIRPRSAGQACC